MGLQAQSLANFQRGSALVHAVEMQAWHACIAQLVAQIGHHVQTKGLDAGAIIAKSLQAQPNPARDFCATRIRKPHELA